MHRKTKKIVFTSLLAAMVCVVTMIIKIPTLTGGYMNIGDGMVLLCGFILGPVWGSLAAGIGSMLADLVGYPIYAIATFLIKALMAFVAYFIAKLLKAIFKKNRLLGAIISVFAIDTIFSIVISFGSSMVSIFTVISETAAIISYIIGIVFAVIGIIASYCATKYILERKLNLD